MMIHQNIVLKYVRQCLHRQFSNLPQSYNPEIIVEALDKHIIGQSHAKRAVAIAFRNRYRRRQLPADIQKEITPANILMKGPTGCGKTEIARRVASLAQAPFVKVEATRYTEVGIVGANTNSMIKDLLGVAIAQEREREINALKVKATIDSDKEMLKLLSLDINEENLSKLRNHEFDDAKVDVPQSILKVSNRMSKTSSNMPTSFSPGEDDEDPSSRLDDFLSTIMSNTNATIISAGNIRKSSNHRSSSSSSTISMKVSDALPHYHNYYINQSLDEGKIIENAKHKTEQEGIVFIDEFDKLAESEDSGMNKRSASLKEGVQKELLSLLEGCQVNTKYGPIYTNHILFIASGAFHQSSISDLFPELQGRLPVRVELKSLTEIDLRRILCEKEYNLIKEMTMLLATEQVNLQFTPDGIDELARYAYLLNSTKGNIGARRLTSVMHTVMEDISYNAHKLSGSIQVINKEYVIERMKSADPLSEQNLSKYIL